MLGLQRITLDKIQETIPLISRSEEIMHHKYILSCSLEGLISLMIFKTTMGSPGTNCLELP